ncbi:MAG: cobalamin biosynthesis protein P47K [Oscillospiraceae bacterium]|jgi:G3E family GTPase|nr:cobalamin biosynthesis protein P47K [Oscillospiraceae bacterium]
MSEPKIIIIGGFLGSGKTTALLSFAGFLVRKSTSDTENKVVIIENEIGDVGIDDKVLRSGGFSVSNLFSGCACCTVSGELTSSVRRIVKELNPEWVVIETTGIAYPSNMRENLQSAIGVDSHIIILADATRWVRFTSSPQLAEIIKGQVVGANSAIVNKIDAAEPTAIEKCTADLKAWEPDIKIAEISAKNGVDDAVWESIL